MEILESDAGLTACCEVLAQNFTDSRGALLLKQLLLRPKAMPSQAMPPKGIFLKQC